MAYGIPFSGAVTIIKLDKRTYIELCKAIPSVLNWHDPEIKSHHRVFNSAVQRGDGVLTRVIFEMDEALPDLKMIALKAIIALEAAGCSCDLSNGITCGIHDIANTQRREIMGGEK